MFGKLLRAIVEKLYIPRMLYLVQRGKVRSQVIPIPEGLPEVLTDITREVLRCQPTSECLCQFIIDYLHAVIVTREKAQGINIFFSFLKHFSNSLLFSFEQRSRA